MHQQIPPAIDQYGVQPQMAPLVICPVQFVYDAQIVLPQNAVPEEIHQQPMLLNVQNPPPWHQNRHPNVIYVQQMPNQILPYMQQNMVQNVYTPHFSYQMPQPIVSQDVIIREIPQVQPKTENNESSRSEKMPILTHLLNQKPIQTQPEKPVMLSQHVQTDFPLKINKNPTITIQPNIPRTEALNEGPQLDGTTVKLDQAKQIDERKSTDNEVPSLVKNETPAGISIASYKPVLRPIVTPTGMKSTINNIPIKLRALDPTQVISIPNYGTITNYTVLNEDKDVRIPTEMQNIQNINTDNKIITAKLNEKNEITFTQNAHKYLPVMPNNITNGFSIGTNTGISETRKVINETPILVSNETQTTGKFAAKAFTNNNSMPVKNDTRKTIKIETITNFNDVRKAVPNEKLTTVTSETLKTVTTGTPKTIKIETLKTVKTSTPIKMTNDTQKSAGNDINKVLNDVPKPVTIQPETIKSIEVQKLTQKVDKKKKTELEKPLVNVTATSKKPEPKTVTPKTLQEIKKKITMKYASNERSRKNDIYILTHVLDGHVIQESNVAFPIYAPAKENYTYEPFHEVARRKRTDDRCYPLKSLQIDDNAKTVEEPIQVTLVPNRPIDNSEGLNETRLVSNTPVTIEPSEVPTNPNEVHKETNDTHEVSMHNKETANSNEVADKTTQLEVDTLKGSRKVAVLSIKRYKGTKETDSRPEVTADSIDRSKVASMSNNKTEVATIPPKTPTKAKVPMVSIQRLEVTTMSIKPHEVAAGSVDTHELAVNVKVESASSLNGGDLNRSSGNQNASEGNKVKSEDNPFLMLQKSSVERWNMDTLFLFLTKNNWKETAEKLKEQEIDGEALLLASKEQLIAVGVDEGQAEIMNDFILNCNTVEIESD